MLIKVYPENPSEKIILKIVEELNAGKVIIFPTDTIYGMGCSIYQPKAISRIAKIKGTKMEKANFSIIFNSLSMLSEFTKPINTSIFRLMRKNLPGPFTFILEANNNVPKFFHGKKKTIGIRIPDNNIIEQIVEKLGHPIVTTSIRDEDTIVEYTTDPELIEEKYLDLVDIVIDGGYGGNEASTVVNCVSGDPEITRLGKGILIE
jgi:tRNA threonylcarbamoyl adenosine modification protein (Sua5/YciO/YrdC/YwlC family)